MAPENYIGQVSFISSNMPENMLAPDSNGIGYMNERTFNRLRSMPIVHDEKEMT